MTTTTTTWISTREAAEILGITPQAVYRLIDRETLPHRRGQPNTRPRVSVPLAAVLDRLSATAADRPPISQAAFETWVRAETGTDDIGRLEPGEIRNAATEFITERRADWTDEEHDAWVNATWLHAVQQRREQA